MEHIDKTDVVTWLIAKNLTAAEASDSKSAHKRVYQPQSPH